METSRPCCNVLDLVKAPDCKIVRPRSARWGLTRSLACVVRIQLRSLPLTCLITAETLAIGEGNALEGKSRERACASQCPAALLTVRSYCFSHAAHLRSSAGTRELALRVR